MVPGYIALGLSSSVTAAPTETLRRLALAAGVATVVAGLVPVSAPSCPQPFVDAEATATDVGHAIASITAFALWTAMPITAFRQCTPGWFRSLSGALGMSTVAGFVAAGVTTNSQSPRKGLAQRAFVGAVVAWYGATAIAELAEG